MLDTAIGQSSFSFGSAIASERDQLPDIELNDVLPDRVSAIEAVAKDHDLIIAFSGGKDSSAIVALCMMAALAMKERGEPTPIIYLLHGDTGVENPIVHNFAILMLSQAVAWGKGIGIDIRTEIYQPTLANSFAVRILSGRELPTYAKNKERRCSVNWKVDPATAAANKIAALLKRDPITGQLRDRPPVTVIGTRYDESNSRRRRMVERHEDAEIPTLNNGRLLLSPICDWTADWVWEFLATSGTDLGVFPVWRPNFQDLVEIYRDAAGGSCVVIPGQAAAGRSACGARTGCVTCTAIATDKSLTAMVSIERNAFMRPLLHMRDFIAAIEHDWTRRRWVSRRNEMRGDMLAVHINRDGFNERTLEELVLGYLTCDAIELDRSEKAGVSPQFSMLPAHKLVATSFYAATLYSLSRPFHFMSLWDRVHNQGERYIPQIPKPYDGPPPPAARVIEISMAGAWPYGLRDPLYAGMTEFCPSQPKDDIFDVDEEAAELALGILWPDQFRNAWLNPEAEPSAEVHQLLGIGAVEIGPHMERALQPVLAKRSAIRLAGLYSLPLDQLLAMGSTQDLVGRQDGRATATPDSQWRLFD
jgi:DNA sulfur modification protein DndC